MHLRFRIYSFDTYDLMKKVKKEIHNENLYISSNASSTTGVYFLIPNNMEPDCTHGMTYSPSEEMNNLFMPVEFNISVSDYTNADLRPYKYLKRIKIFSHSTVKVYLPPSIESVEVCSSVTIVNKDELVNLKNSKK